VVGPGSSVTVIDGTVSAAGRTLIVEGEARLQVSEAGEVEVEVSRGSARLDDVDLAEGDRWPHEAVEDRPEYAREARMPLFASVEPQPPPPAFVAPITEPHPNYEKTREFRRLVGVRRAN